MSTNKLKNIVLSTSGTPSGSNIIYTDSNNKLIDSGNVLCFQNYFAHIVDEKSNNTEGGSYTANTDVTRTLNTIRIRIPNTTWVSISSNIVTIDGANYPGVYYFKFNVPFHNVETGFGSLRDITDTNEYNGLVIDSGPNASVGSLGFHVEEITKSKNYDIRFVANGSGTTNGLGRKHGLNSDPETFAQLYIEKIN